MNKAKKAIKAKPAKQYVLVWHLNPIKIVHIGDKQLSCINENSRHCVGKFFICFLFFIIYFQLNSYPIYSGNHIAYGDLNTDGIYSFILLDIIEK